MDPLPEGFSCQIVKDMDTLYLDASIPTGGRMTAEQAERLSIHLWGAAQEIRRMRGPLALEVANRLRAKLPRSTAPKRSRKRQ